MRILKRTKGILNFRTVSGIIRLKSGENTLTEGEGDLIKSHPMYKQMVKTSGLFELAETSEVEAPKAKISEPKTSKKETAKIKAAKLKAAKIKATELKAAELKAAEDKAAEDEAAEDEAAEPLDISDIDLEKQSVEILVEIAEEFKLETEGLTAEELIKSIKARS
tara:strand:- start:404 stop:898 length:495 start_codon:yes stop_codon:yes gene_type:complete